MLEAVTVSQVLNGAENVEYTQHLLRNRIVSVETLSLVCALTYEVNLEVYRDEEEGIEIKSGQ